jgi:DNA-binding MarR family transcriptional regulator
MSTAKGHDGAYGRSSKGVLLTELILAIFQANVDLVESGPFIAQDEEMTSIRWQTLNALKVSAKTAAQIGRELGLSRQGALWNTQALEELELVEQIDNPSDRRAKLVSLTAKGRERLDGANVKQSEWVNALAKQFTVSEIETTLQVIARLHGQVRQSVGLSSSPNE